MKIFKSISEIQFWRNALPPDLVVGFVPTMGALHDGHASLLENSRRDTDLTVLSIFVNPTQFNQPEDFEKYPASIEADLKLAENIGVDAVFLPNQEMMYPSGYKLKVTETDFSKKLCGQFRPGHFDGVLTVVLKLFNIIRPHSAFFGEKDYQQLTLIKNMISDLFLDIELVSVPTLREASGLAMSSRNVRLSDGGRRKAALIYQTLKEASDVEVAKRKLSDEGFEVEYIEDHFERRFIAAHLEGVRLIDNISVSEIKGMEGANL